MRLHVLPSRHCLRQNRFDLLVVIDVLLSTTTLVTAMECLPDRVFVDPTMERPHSVRHHWALGGFGR